MIKDFFLELSKLSNSSGMIIFHKELLYKKYNREFIDDLVHKKILCLPGEFSLDGVQVQYLDNGSLHEVILQEEGNRLTGVDESLLSGPFELLKDKDEFLLCSTGQVCATVAERSGFKLCPPNDIRSPFHLVGQLQFESWKVSLLYLADESLLKAFDFLSVTGHLQNSGFTNHVIIVPYDVDKNLYATLKNNRITLISIDECQRNFRISEDLYINKEQGYSLSGIFEKLQSKSVVIDSIDNVIYIHGIALDVRSGVEAYNYIYNILSEAIDKDVSVDRFAKDFLGKNLLKDDSSNEVSQIKKKVKKVISRSFDKGSSDYKVIVKKLCDSSKKKKFLRCGFQKSEIFLWA